MGTTSNSIKITSYLTNMHQKKKKKKKLSKK